MVILQYKFFVQLKKKNTENYCENSAIFRKVSFVFYSVYRVDYQLYVEYGHGIVAETTFMSKLHKQTNVSSCQRICFAHFCPYWIVLCIY